MTLTRQQLKQTWGRALFLAGTAALVSGCSAPPSSTQEAAPASAPAPAPSPVAAASTSINELMVAWIDNASHVLWDVEKPGFAPKNEADWVEVEDHAIQLAAAGTMIQLTGTGPSDSMWVQQEGWKTNAKLMADAGRAAQAAAKGRDLPALVKANGELVATCEGCHKAFKPSAPTEGITHQSPHSESHKGN
jgi:hypothetical protein